MKITRMGQSTLMMAAVATAIIGLASEAHAWGRIGHRASARLTESLLSPSARAAVAGLLEPGETLADASLWADEIRSQRRETGPWHYVNVPISETKYDARFCPAEGCVISAIATMKATLKNPSASKTDRREALRFLSHFVQDMHQPVHVGHRDDRGGNNLQVQFFNKGSNLHRVWDSGLIEHHSTDEGVWAADLKTLATPENIAKWSQGTPEDWATESLTAARTAYLDGQLKKGAKLGDPYQAIGLPIARQRMAQAGVRLAWMLNDLFPASN